MNVKLLADLLGARGYDVATADSGPRALEEVTTWKPDLVLLDVVMPGMSGYDVCRAIRAEPVTATLPIVLVTALDPEQERVKGLEAGADDFLTKPVSQPELLARVQSLLRIKSLHDEVQRQAAELREWNRSLQARVQEQVDQLERLLKLRRFLSPQVAEAILSKGSESMLASHRTLIATLFCDLRGFTAFSETAEPEETMEVLGAYHESMGQIIHAHGGTIDHRSGDGIMVIFNDPLPCEDPAGDAVRAALAMRDQMKIFSEEWRRLGHRLGFGLGVSLGYATIGVIGFEGRFDYSANGSAVNLAARLCDAAADGQILVGQRVHAAVEHLFLMDGISDLNLKGFHQPVAAYNVLSLRHL